MGQDRVMEELAQQNVNRFQDQQKTEECITKRSEDIPETKRSNTENDGQRYNISQRSVCLHSRKRSAHDDMSNINDQISQLDAYASRNASSMMEFQGERTANATCNDREQLRKHLSLSTMSGRNLKEVNTQFTGEKYDDNAKSFVQGQIICSPLSDAKHKKYFNDTSQQIALPV